MLLTGLPERRLPEGDYDLLQTGPTRWRVNVQGQFYPRYHAVIYLKPRNRYRPYKVLVFREGRMVRDYSKATAGSLFAAVKSALGYIPDYPLAS